MFNYSLPILIAVIFLASGCATTGSKVNQDQLQARVVDLEKKLEEKDAEIVDLQYEVKDLSSKVETGRTSGNEGVYTETPMEAMAKAVGKDDIIRVNITTEKLQNALKAAGAYAGKVDGKLGAGTKAAIKDFQRAHGLKADGIVGKKTWDELKAYLK